MEVQKSIIWGHFKLSAWTTASNFWDVYSHVKRTGRSNKKNHLVLCWCQSFSAWNKNAVAERMAVSNLFFKGLGHEISASDLTLHRSGLLARAEGQAMKTSNRIYHQYWQWRFVINPACSTYGFMNQTKQAGAQVKYSAKMAISLRSTWSTPGGLGKPPDNLQ